MELHLSECDTDMRRNELVYFPSALVPKHEVTISEPSRTFPLRKCLLFFCHVALAIGLPLLMLMTYQRHALNAGIILGSGCHGPELPFGLLSGFLFVLFLRFSSQK